MIHILQSGFATLIICEFHAELEREVADLESQVTTARETYEEVASQLEVRRARLRECDQEIMALMKQKEELSKQLTDNNVERKKLEHK